MDGIRIEVRRLIQVYLTRTAEGQDLFFETLNHVWPGMPELLTDAKKTLDLDTRLLKWVTIGVLAMYGIFYAVWEILTRLNN